MASVDSNDLQYSMEPSTEESNPQTSHSENDDHTDEDSERPNQSLDALYVPVKTPVGENALLRFQWMRLHPATAMACLPVAVDNRDSDGTIKTVPPGSSIVEVSRALPAYRDALWSKAGEDPLAPSGNCHQDATTTTTPTEPQSRPLVQSTGVTIDLCEYLLVDPPLMSQSTSAMFD